VGVAAPAARRFGGLRPRIVEALSAYLGSAADWVVPSPALVYALAMVASLVVLRYRSRHAPGIEPYHTLGMALWMMVGGLVGARTFYLGQHYSEILADPVRVLAPGGATASWGAYLGGGAALALYCARHRLGGLRYADLVAPVVGLTMAVGRWACFLNGDDYGTRSEVPWAVRFPHASYPFVDHVRAGLVSPLDAWSLPVHPVQLYLSASGLFLFFAGTWFWRRHRDRPGATLCFFWLLASLTRFALEFYRGDHHHFVLGLPSSQFMALLTGVASAAGLWWMMRPSLAQPAPRSSTTSGS
jgi:phosphatidylglycerol:prolipoprotein diacylglycerol transferase